MAAAAAAPALGLRLLLAVSVWLRFGALGNRLGIPYLGRDTTTLNLDEDMRAWIIVDPTLCADKSGDELEVMNISLWALPMETPWELQLLHIRRMWRRPDREAQAEPGTLAYDTEPPPPGWDLRAPDGSEPQAEYQVLGLRMLKSDWTGRRTLPVEPTIDLLPGDCVAWTAPRPLVAFFEDADSIVSGARMPRVEWVIGQDGEPQLVSAPFKIADKHERKYALQLHASSKLLTCPTPECELLRTAPSRFMPRFFDQVNKSYYFIDRLAGEAVDGPFVFARLYETTCPVHYCRVVFEMVRFVMALQIGEDLSEEQNIFLSLAMAVSYLPHILRMPWDLMILDGWGLAAFFAFDRMASTFCGLSVFTFAEVFQVHDMAVEIGMRQSMDIQNALALCDSPVDDNGEYYVPLHVRERLDTVEAKLAKLVADAKARLWRPAKDLIRSRLAQIYEEFLKVALTMNAHFMVVVMSRRIWRALLTLAEYDAFDQRVTGTRSLANYTTLAEMEKAVEEQNAEMRAALPLPWRWWLYTPDTREASVTRQHRLTLCEGARRPLGGVHAVVLGGFIREVPPVPTGRFEVELLLFAEKSQEMYRKTMRREHWTWTGEAAPKSSAEAWFCTSDLRANDWRMECLWGSNGTAGSGFMTDGYIYSMVGTSARANCPVPSSGELATSPLALDVIFTNGAEKAVLPLTFCEEAQDVRKGATICSKPLFRAHELQELYPQSLEDWVNYHGLIGIDHVQLYDTDGSFEPWLRDSRGFIHGVGVTYVRRFPGMLSDSIQQLSESEFPYCTETLAFDHCLFSNYHKTKWVIMLHALDAYIHSPAYQPGRPSLVEALQALATQAADSSQEPLCGVSLRAVWFGDPAGDCHGQHCKDTRLLARFRHRSDALEPWNRSELAVNPEQALYAHSHKPICRAASTTRSMDPDLWRANHYVDMMGSRCGKRFGNVCVEPDDSIAWSIGPLESEEKGPLDSLVSFDLSPAVNRTRRLDFRRSANGMELRVFPCGGDCAYTIADGPPCNIVEVYHHVCFAIISALPHLVRQTALLPAAPGEAVWRQSRSELMMELLHRAKDAACWEALSQEAPEGLACARWMLAHAVDLARAAARELGGSSEQLHAWLFEAAVSPGQGGQPPLLPWVDMRQTPLDFRPELPSREWWRPEGFPLANIATAFREARDGVVAEFSRGRFLTQALAESAAGALVLLVGDASSCDEGLMPTLCAAAQPWLQAVCDPPGAQPPMLVLVGARPGSTLPSSVAEDNARLQVQMVLRGGAGTQIRVGDDVLRLESRSEDIPVGVLDPSFDHEIVNGGSEDLWMAVLRVAHRSCHASAAPP